MINTGSYHNLVRCQYLSNIVSVFIYIKKEGYLKPPPPPPPPEEPPPPPLEELPPPPEE